jgi:hypothetical protein
MLKEYLSEGLPEELRNTHPKKECSVEAFFFFFFFITLLLAIKITY